MGCSSCFSPAKAEKRPAEAGQEVKRRTDNAENTFGCYKAEPEFWTFLNKFRASAETKFQANGPAPNHLSRVYRTPHIS
jgi:hypothetical protein